MQNQLVINSSYYCIRGNVGGQILVMNNGAYVIGHFSEYTRELVWQRVVPATDRKSIEDWLTRHFPPKTEAEKLAKQNRAAAAPAR